MNKLIPAMRMRTDKKVRQFDNKGCGSLAGQMATGITFSIVLHSSSEVSTCSLQLEAFPSTVAELQRHIETEFSVPQCCQSVVFESVPLHADDSLHDNRVRNGDTFHVYYKSEADVKDIRGVVDSMQEALATIEDAYNLCPHYYSPDHKFEREDVLGLIFLLDQTVNPDTVECLATHYFHPFTSERAIANRLFFLDIGALDLLHKLHCVVSKYPWEVTVYSLQCLEKAILRVLWNITASFDIRLQVLQYPFIPLCVKSALRVPIKHKVVSPKHLAFSGHPTPMYDNLQDYTLGEMMYKAFGVLFNLAELPQCQVQIASESALLKQGIMLALSPTYKHIASLVIAAGMVCLAYNRETHKYLVKQDILRLVVEVVSMTRPLHGITQQEAQQNKTLLGYFASLLLAQVLTSSIQLVSEDTLPRLYRLIQEFLNTADPTMLHDHEQANGYVWSTIKPHLNLAYFPINSKPNDYYVFGGGRNNVTYTIYFHELYLQCIEVGVISLQNMLLGEETRQVLQTEGLVDFVVCLPWYLPPGSKPQIRACELVRSLSTFVKLEPPSLANIARAKLAADIFGLERTLNAYSINDLSPS